MSDTGPVRIKLGERVENLGPPGTIVEIDLLGDGVTGFYSRLIAFHCGSRDEDIITATEMLRLAVAALKEAISSKKSREDTDFWLWLLRWLDTIELILSTRDAEAGVRKACRNIRLRVLRMQRQRRSFSPPVSTPTSGLGMLWFPQADEVLERGLAMKPCLRFGAWWAVAAAVVLMAGASILHSRTQAEPPPEQTVIFADGCETGDTSAWSAPSLECLSIFAPPVDVTE